MRVELPRTHIVQPLVGPPDIDGLQEPRWPAHGIAQLLQPLIGQSPLSIWPAIENLQGNQLVLVGLKELLKTIGGRLRLCLVVSRGDDLVGRDGVDLHVCRGLRLLERVAQLRLVERPAGLFLRHRENRPALIV